jgi:hypothetical protein
VRRARRLANIAAAKAEGKTHGPRRKRYSQLILAACLTAAYQCGYRDATGDRAIALAEQQREARRRAERDAADRWERDQRRRLLGSAAA